MQPTLPDFDSLCVFYLLDFTEPTFCFIDRPTAVYVMHHPLFWSPELRLSFLRDTSDRIEKTSETDLINALESVGPVAFGGSGKWGDKLDAALVTDMGRYRKYNFESIRDLLRYIRNKSGHYRELSEDLKVRCAALVTVFDFVFWCMHAVNC